jgi:hypothetical protein
MLRRSSQPNSRGQDIAQFGSYSFSRGIRRTDNPSADNSAYLVKNFDLEDDGSLALRKPLFLKHKSPLVNKSLIKIIYPFTLKDENIIYATTTGFFTRDNALQSPFEYDKFQNKNYKDVTQLKFENISYANFNTSTIISGVQVREENSLIYKYRFIRLTYNELTNTPELEILPPFIPTTNNFSAGDFNLYADVLQSLRDDYLSSLTLVNVIHQYALYQPVGTIPQTVKDLTRGNVGVEKWRMFGAVVPGTAVYLKAFVNLKREDMHRYYCAWQYTEDGGLTWNTSPEFLAKFSTTSDDKKKNSIVKMKRLDKTLIDVVKENDEKGTDIEYKYTDVEVVPLAMYTDDDLIDIRPDILKTTADNVTRRFVIFVLESPETNIVYKNDNPSHHNFTLEGNTLIRKYPVKTSLILLIKQPDGLGGFTESYKVCPIKNTGAIQSNLNSDMTDFYYDTPTLSPGASIKLYSVILELDSSNMNWNYDETKNYLPQDTQINVRLKNIKVENLINYEFETIPLAFNDAPTNQVNGKLYYAGTLFPANDLLGGEYSDNSELVVEQNSNMGIYIHTNNISPVDEDALLNRMPIRNANNVDNPSYFGPYYTILNKNKYNYIYLPSSTLNIQTASVREYAIDTLEEELEVSKETVKSINATAMGLRTVENFCKKMDTSSGVKKIYIQIPLYSANDYKIETKVDIRVTVLPVEIQTEAIDIKENYSGVENPPEDLNLIALSELEHTIPLDDLNDIIESELKPPASAKHIVNYNKSIYAYGGEKFENNILVSEPDDMLFSIKQLLDLDSRENTTVTSIIPWRDYLLVATESSIYLVTRVEGGFVNKAVNTFIGMNENDGDTFKAILNGTILKSGTKIFSLSPNPSSSDDSILNIQEIGAPLTDLIPDNNFKNIGFTTESYYGVFVKDTDSQGNIKTYLFKYYYSYKVWVMLELPINLLHINFTTINEVILTDTIGNEYYLDKERIDFFDIFKYGDSLLKTQEELEALANTRRNYVLPQNEAEIAAFDQENANIITPFEFVLDSGEKATDYLYNKYFMESKFTVATLEKTLGYFPVNVDIYMDGIKSVVKQEVKSSSNFWATDQKTLATLSTTTLRSNASNLANIVKTLTLRHAGKGKTVRHVLSGQSLNYFKFLQVFYKYRLLPGQN